MLGYIATSPRINMLCAVGAQMVLARITAPNFCYPSEQEFLQAVDDNVRNMKSQGAEYIIMFLH
jgi:hypothetical protein